MNIGDLRQRVTIQTVSTKQDTYGQVADAVGSTIGTDFAKVWGSVKDLAGRELFAAQEMHSQVTTRIVIRWLRGVLPSMQARTNAEGGQGRTFDIMAVVDPDGRRRTLYLECKERVA